jgi:pyruvate/2-oxoglutarate dehydrogenase complex dihydrolipoamide acyltransferase (E2) component
MKSFGVCVALLVGLGSLPALAAPALKIAQQVTPAAPAASPPTASPPAATPAATAPAPAAAVPAKPKIKAAKAKPGAAKKVPSAIRVENKRTVTLKRLQISLTGASGKIVGKIAKAIPGGKNGLVALKGAKGCEYDVKWEFEDAADESTADLCNDPRIVLTD